MSRGKVYIVGAGPGAVDLLTLRAWRLLGRAEVVLYDRLVNPKILEEIRPGALLIDVGKRLRQSSSARQNTIHQLLIEHVETGKLVVRLKGGDPFIFGRGGEEVAVLAEAGIETEVVPGISSAIAAPASAGIPVTMRGVASSFAVFAGHPAEGRNDDGIDWEIAARMETAVFLMGVGRLPLIVAHLLAHGRSPETPVALVEKGTLPEEQVVTGTLADIVEKAAHINPPAALVVGEVVLQRAAVQSMLGENGGVLKHFPTQKIEKPITYAGVLTNSRSANQQQNLQGVSSWH